MSSKTKRLDSFDLSPGRVLAGKYIVDEFLGSGWEGEVYRVVERRTDVQRAAKLFFPQRNESGRAVKINAQKLDRLRSCPSVMQYHHSESLRVQNTEITCLIGEYVDGMLLTDFIKAQPGARMAPFEALHLLHSVVKGLELIHTCKEYHGDLHTCNVLVKRRGINFEVRFVDLQCTGRVSAARQREDIVEAVRILFEATGGSRWYARQPHSIKAICRGMRHDLIGRIFPTASRLRAYLEAFSWSEMR